MFAHQNSTQDVAPGPVGEGVEHGIGPVLVLGGVGHTDNIQPNSCMSSESRTNRLVSADCRELERGEEEGPCANIVG